jgi:hypothetical protein
MMGGMDEPEWMRQPGLACEYCGGPGHLIAVPPPISLALADIADASQSFAMETRVTCPEHRFLVENRAKRMQDEERFAERDHGRPVLGAETHPDRLRRSVGTIIRRLSGWDGPEDGR